jgi:hypothetical protein
MTDQENVKSPSSLGALGDTKLYGKIPAYSINEEMKGNLLVLASFYKYLLPLLQPLCFSDKKMSGHKPVFDRHFYLIFFVHLLCAIS